MKLIFLSDTHGYHRSMEVPAGDMIFCCGDFCGHGTGLGEVEDFASWFGGLPCRFKVLVAGNHDFVLEHPGTVKRAERVLREANIEYLCDDGLEALGLKIWGSPVQPRFCNMAFNRRRGEEIARHWAKIPNGVDILITHGPPAGRLDAVHGGENVGCADLLSAVARARPRIHAFGHIHEGAGRSEENGTVFLNASILDRNYRISNPALTLDISLTGLQPTEGNPGEDREKI